MDSTLETVFDDNAATYDRVNSLISLGLDRGWRAWAAEEATPFPGARVLDAFAGTGLVGLEAAARGAEVTLADVSPKMLEVARRHARQRGLAAEYVLADLTAPTLPFAPASFDAISVMFGVRYLTDPVSVLRRLASLLVDAGRLVIVEFVVPEPSPVSAVASAYFFHVIPHIAPLLGGRDDLHHTLAETTQALGGFEHLHEIAESAGLDVLRSKVMGFGMVAGLGCARREMSRVEVSATG